MSETGQNFRALPESTLAIAWPRIAADIARLQPRPAPPLPWFTPGPTRAALRERSYALSKLAVGGAVVVKAARADTMVALATKREPAKAFRKYWKSTALIVVERIR